MSNAECVKRYHEKCDTIVLRPLKSENIKNRIVAAAAAAGQSVQSYVLQAVRARMDADGVPDQVPELGSAADQSDA